MPNKTRLFIDLPHLAHRTLYAAPGLSGNPKPDFSIHRHFLMNSIISNVKKFNPDETILAIDDRNNWRKKVYPEYKANRQLKRDADVFPWSEYFEYMNEFTEDIKDTFPMVVLKVRYCEADDVIGILVRHLSQSKINYIITSDRDYIQLLSAPNVKLLDPIKGKFVEEPDPMRYLDIKVIVGDKGDNVPGIKVRLGEKTAIKILSTDGEFEKLMADPEVKKNYDRNRLLIDLQSSPDVIKKEIIQAYDGYSRDRVFDQMKCLRFMVKHKLRKLSDEIDTLARIFNKKGRPEPGVSEFF